MTGIGRFASIGRSVLTAVAMLGLSSAGVQAAEWMVSKASGQVWVESERPQPASLGTQTTLLPGDAIRTGSNGRVLLVRGEETILVAPNSVVALPDQAQSGLATTILQQAGSITVKAQKRDFNHFEVQTPYLAAVVKGTEFTVVIDGSFVDVQVRSGRVEVTDFKSGQIALVLPGQAAHSSTPEHNGLNLRGSGTFNPVQQGTPNKAPVERVNVPKGGLGAPPSKPGQHVRPLTAAAIQAPALPKGVVRIGSPIGLKLDVHKATGGLARSETGLALSSTRNATLWNSTGGPGVTASASTSSSGGGGSSSGGGTSVSASTSVGGGGGISAGVSAGGGSGIGINAGVGSVGVGANVGGGSGIGAGVNIGSGPGINVGVGGGGGINLNVGNIGIGIGKK